MRVFPFSFIFFFLIWCFLTTLGCSVLASPELSFHPYSGSAFHFTWKYSCFLREEGVIVPQGSFPLAISAILWSTGRARSSPCSIQHTMKHHGPLLNGCLGAVIWGGCFSQAAKKALTDTELLSKYPFCRLPAKD